MLQVTCQGNYLSGTAQNFHFTTGYHIGTGKTRFMVTLFVVCVFWASLSYFAALSGINLAVLVVRLLRDFSLLKDRLDFGIVDIEVKGALVPVVPGTGVEPVATIKAPLVRALTAMAGSTQVPLAHRIGVITGVLENLSDRRRGSRKMRLVARLTHGGRIDRVVEGRQSHLDGVVSGQEHGARHRADRRHVEVGEERAFLRQRIEVGSLGHRTTDAEIAETNVVADDQQDVGAYRVGLCHSGARGCEHHIYQEKDYEVFHRSFLP